MEFTSQFQIKAKLIVPILQTSHTLNNAKDPNLLWGLLIAHHCDRPRQWGEFELELMQQLADQISIALAQAQLLEHLEEIVEIRTAELQDANHTLRQEITDRMQAEEVLRQSEEQLRLIINALPVLIAYVDNQQQYRFNNQAYAAWLGKLPSEIYGNHLQAIWGNDCYQRMKAPVELALTGQVVTYENEIILKDGSSCCASVTYIPHITEQNPKQLVVKGFFVLASDTSDRKTNELMKDEFISMMSHALRTPLTSIHSALKILTTGRLGNLSTEGKQMLAIADENTERLVHLINNVLDLQRIEASAVTMEKQACNARALMVEATEAMKPMARQHGVSLIAEFIDLQLWADFDYIVQALTNLLSNAIKFSPSGATVSLRVERQASEALFRVCDRGQGIPSDKLEIIFERFQQVDSSDSRKKGGSGLGLAICRKIIEQHNGKIWAESRLGQGSTFCFTLPLYISTLEKGV